MRGEVFRFGRRRLPRLRLYDGYGAHSGLVWTATVVGALSALLRRSLLVRKSAGLDRSGGGKVPAQKSETGLIDCTARFPPVALRALVARLTRLP